jgi:hypothetical protein
MKAIAVAQGERPMQKIKESPELRRIKQWYERIIRGERPTKTELQFHFRHYADQAEMLVRRVEDGQTWEDFVSAWMETEPPSVYKANWLACMLSSVKTAVS